MPAISLLGCGAMGSALAASLLSAGHRVTVWNRTRARADALLARGATVAATAADAIGASDLTIACLLDYAAVHDVLGPAAGALAGRTLVNLTNGTPNEVLALAPWVTAQGAAYVDGAIMVTPDMIGGPHGAVLYSGDRAAYERHAPSLAALVPGTFLDGAVSRAALYDLALLTSMFGMFGGVLQAAALLRSDAITVGAVGPMLVELLHAMVDLVPEILRQVDTGDSPVPTSTNGMMAVGARNVVTGTREQGVVDLIAPVAELLERGVAAGLGNRDLAALVPLLARRDETSAPS